MNIEKEVSNYQKYYPEESTSLNPLLLEIEENPSDLWNRTRTSGHVVASAIIIHEDKMLMIFHPFLKKWLQPGGHIDLGESPIQAAKRELLEETGFTGSLHPWHNKHSIPVDISIHRIPANASKKEPAHLHYDFRYLFSLDVNTPEEKQAQHHWSWIDIEEIKEQNLINLFYKINMQSP
jgi:8-oxo-dGTP pyrophosphatase MutT (NUDIX family)